MNQGTQLTRRELLETAAVAGGTIACGLPTVAGEPMEARTSLPQVKPEDIGIDPKRLQIAYDLMEKWTTGKDAPVPGGAILVGRNGKTVAPRFFGRQGPEADAGPIRKDAMFYMASVTKPIIYMGAMLLVERGQLNLSDKVTRYIPEFTGGGKEDAQVLHLFTHTSGLPDELPNNTELRRQHSPLKKFVEGSIKAELLFKPGTRFSYQSSGTILVAEIIQRLSGKSIQEFVRREIIDPLGLKSTGLGSQGFARERLHRATVPDYQAGTDFSWNSSYWQEFGSPAGGLFSTPEDYAVICALMLGGGKVGGVRLLSAATARMMTSNRMARAGASHSTVGSRLAAQPPGNTRQLERSARPACLRSHRVGRQRGLDGPTDARLLHRVVELPSSQGTVAIGSRVECDRGGIRVMPSDMGEDNTIDAYRLGR